MDQNLSWFIVKLKTIPALEIIDLVFMLRSIDDSAKGGLIQFWELFTMIPCVPKYLKR